MFVNFYSPVANDGRIADQSGLCIDGIIATTPLEFSDVVPKF